MCVCVCVCVCMCTRALTTPLMSISLNRHQCRHSVAAAAGARPRVSGVSGAESRATAPTCKAEVK